MTGKNETIDNRRSGRSHEYFMGLALRASKRGLGNVGSNPSVGCVLVENETIISIGRTQAGGRPHGEVDAFDFLNKTGRGKIAGLTAYVTLEPCAHHGQTPPCAERLIAEGVSTLVYAHSDIDPRVAGKGLQMLSDAGVEIVGPVCEKEAAHLHRGFFTRIAKSRPMVSLKLAASRNGFMRTPAGQSAQITGEAVRRQVHLMRAEHDAILTGIDTVIADDPKLDCRLPGMAGLSPRPVVLDSHARLPDDCHLARDPRRTIMLTGETARERIDIEQYRVTSSKKALYDGLDIEAALHVLAEIGINRLMVECGPTLARSFLAAGLVDDLVIFTSPNDIELVGESDMTYINIEAFTSRPSSSSFRTAHLRQDRLMGVDRLQHWSLNEEI